MKMLFIHGLDSYTGSSKVGAEVVKNFDNKDLIFINCKGGAFLKDSVSKKNIFRNLSRYYLINFILFQITGFSYILKNSKKYDIIFINALLPFLPLIATLFTRRVKVFQYIHEQKIMNPVLNFLCISSTKIIKPRKLYSSYFLRDHHIKALGDGYVLNPFVSDDFFKNIEKKIYDKKIILMVTSLKEYKGVTKFINISNRFSLTDINLEFHLVLSCDPIDLDIYLKLNNLKINNNLKIYFKPNNIIEIFNSSTIVVNLTQRNNIIESFGLSLVEAIACCKPILCPNIGGPLEINKNEEFGFFINERSEDDICDKLSKLVYDKKIYNEKKNACIKYRFKFNSVTFKSKLNNIINNYDYDKL